MSTLSKEFIEDKDNSYYNNNSNRISKEVNTKKKFEESIQENSSSINNIANNQNIKKEEPENATATCFSSEAEQKFKSKDISRLNSFLQRQFNPPEFKDGNSNSKFSDLKARTIWTVIMLLSFFVFIAAGQVYCSILVLLILTFIFMELTNLNKYKDRNNEIKWYYTIGYYFFFLWMYFFNMRTIREITISFEKYKIYHLMIKYHNLICFILLCLGLIIFLKSLQQGYYRYQVSSFGYNQLISIMLSFVCSLLISNIMNGLFWFVLPCGMVICNDVSAYIWGRMFGKTKLTILSPKKTVEGYVGALITTIIYAYVMSYFFIKFEMLQSFLCPMKELNFVPFSIQNCDISHYMKSHTQIYSFDFQDLNIHTMVIALFTSTIAPMGGFLASGFKRAINIKDFSDTIPGHGGFTDRMDCQLLVGVFTSLWLSHFVYSKSYLFLIVIKLLDQLSEEGKNQIYKHIKESIKISS